ncbi:MAG: phosphopentomutase [Proteobacteria bacterium]|nr:MAG: phosphopentomutase [Pseudomonadota bacterium]
MRAFLLVLDSLGVGSAPDAARFGDAGADTLGHIAEHCAAGRADVRGGRCGPLALPNLAALGIGRACELATGRIPPGLEPGNGMRGGAGCAAEVSTGKDSQSGHWEIAGAPVTFEWGYFPATSPCFPPDIVAELCRRADLPGILGNCHASGTAIVDALGERHLRTLEPICYTSADSVFQIAAHEHAFGLQRLYRTCEIARELLDPLRIGRVIARPFVGRGAGDFERTANRRDYGVPPHDTTVLRLAIRARRQVVSVGKIGDLFCHESTGLEIKGGANAAVFDALLRAAERLDAGGLLCANFVDFDTLHGHRRDPAGYAAALEAFDARLPELEALLRPGDLVILTGDHGCDPTWRGTDHTREFVPILAFGPQQPSRDLGRRASFADIGATLAAHLDLPPTPHGLPLWRVP